MTKFQLPAERTIQTIENAGWIVRVSRLSREGDLQHRGDEGGGDAVSSNVGDQNADPPFIDAKEIIEIAGNGAHGHVTCSNFEPFKHGDILREYRELKLAGDLQLPVDRKKSFFVRERAAR